jgi:AcrR family transcriptional regulator
VDAVEPDVSYTSLRLDESNKGVNVVLREQKKLMAWRTIRAEALRLFAEQGYEATTIEQIAAAAGVSRATFFNYFDAKASVVFDQDPAERVAWREMMDSQPDSLPLWDALSAIILQMTESLGDRMLLQRQLKQNDPALVKATQAYGHSFLEELTSWVQARTERLNNDELASKLQINLALACATTAYQAWGRDEDFEAFVEHTRRCLAQGRPQSA